MPKTHSLAAWALGCLSLVAAGIAVGASAASRVEGYLSGVSSWSADFTQTIGDDHGNVSRSAAGHLYLQRPGKFRWDYTDPSEQLVLADGAKLWFYDKDLAQANVRDVDATLASTPAMLLSSSDPIGSQFDISSLPMSGGLEWFRLTPKRAGTDFQSVKIGFAKGELSQMVLVDKLNEVTRLTFSGAQRNPQLRPDLFSFTPPPGVDVIGRNGQ